MLPENTLNAQGSQRWMLWKFLPKSATISASDWYWCLKTAWAENEKIADPIVIHNLKHREDQQELLALHREHNLAPPKFAHQEVPPPPQLFRFDPDLAVQLNISINDDLVVSTVPSGKVGWC